MGDAKNNKERNLMRMMVCAWILAATLGGCVISLNIQKKQQQQ